MGSCIGDGIVAGLGDGIGDGSGIGSCVMAALDLRLVLGKLLALDSELV